MDVIRRNGTGLLPVIVIRPSFTMTESASSRLLQPAEAASASGTIQNTERVPIRWINRMRISLIAWTLIVGCAACNSKEATPVPLGSPFPELNADELERFRQGEALFNRVFTVE